MRKIAIIFTGGTISMKVDPKLKAAVPVMSGEEILEFIPHVRNLNIEIINFSKIDSSQMHPETMLRLAQTVQEQLDQPDICGVVITHGTDTLEETAYFLDLAVDSEKPVALVGAMRSVSELSWDGPANLIAAIFTVISDEARHKGVVVVMNNEIHSAQRVTKTNTFRLDAFESPDFGPIGVVDGGDVIFYGRSLKRQHIKTTRIESRVDLIKTAAGCDSRFLKAAVDTGARGIVIEGLGRGNLPEAMVEGVEYALKSGVILVLVSRALAGRVFESYGFPGSGKHLKDLGVIFGGSLSGQKARIKLMLALGATDNREEIRKLFEAPEY